MENCKYCKFLADDQEAFEKHYAQDLGRLLTMYKTIERCDKCRDNDRFEKIEQLLKSSEREE